MIQSRIISLFLLLLSVSSPSWGQQEEPSYGIYGNDTTVQIFLYSPNPSQGLHLAYLCNDDQWRDMGQLCTSAFVRHGMKGGMYNPYVISVDGSYRLLFGIGEGAFCFGASFSDDLVNWRPQDFPMMSVDDCRQPIAFTNNDNGFDIYFKAKGGPRFLTASGDFRKFSADEASTIDDVAWLRDTATIAGKVEEGNLFEIAKVHFDYIGRYLQALANDRQMSAMRMADDAARFASLSNVSATLSVDMQNVKNISEHLFGLDFEDINNAVDGGLNAEMVQDGDFEYYSSDHQGWNGSTAWTSGVTGAPMEVDTVYPVSKNNPHYLALSSAGILNNGFDGMTVRADSLYVFSVQARLLNQHDKKRKLLVTLVDSDGYLLADGKLTVVGESWAEYKLALKVERPKDKKNLSKFSGARLSVAVQGDGRVAVDMVSLKPFDTYKGHGLRRDLAESIVALHPKFLRFGALSPFSVKSVGEISDWKMPIGKLWDCTPSANPRGGHPSKGLGLEDIFRFCEDAGCEPLPIIAAGESSPCAEATRLDTQSGSVDRKDMPDYCKKILEFIGWARRNHHLHRIGIEGVGHVTTPFEERSLMICKAIKQNYPDMKIMVAAGDSHYPSADNIEGWAFAKSHKNCIDIVEENATESSGWLITHSDYFDDYSGKGAKVSLGKYCCPERTLEAALSEAAYLCNVERNGDVVDRASYSPLLCNTRHKNQDHALICFENDSVSFTPSYYTQLLFSNYCGNRYLHSDLKLNQQNVGVKQRVSASVVSDTASGRVFVRLVNMLPREVSLSITGLNVPEGSAMISFSGCPSDEKTQLKETSVGSSLTLSPYSMNVIIVK